MTVGTLMAEIAKVIRPARTHHVDLVCIVVPRPRRNLLRIQLEVTPGKWQAASGAVASLKLESVVETDLI